MRKKIIYTILVTALTATVLTGCGRTQDTDAVDVVSSETEHRDADLVVTETAAPDPGADAVKKTEETKTAPKPVATTKEPVDAAALKPAETEVSKPVETVTPKTAETEVPKTVEAVTAKSAETEIPEPTETATPRSVEMSVPKPAETATPKSVEMSVSKSTETASSQPVETPVSTLAPTPAPTLAPCNHNYVKTYWPSAPTCTASGDYTMVCSICGDAGGTGTDPKLDHTPVTYTKVDAVNCDEQGIRITTCNVCGAELGREGFDGSEHDWITGQGDPYWSEEALNFVTEEVTYCSRCGAQK